MAMIARRIRTTLFIAAGYGVALAAAAALVALRYTWANPADVAASPGMYAFGDVLWFLMLAGFFSLVPSFFLWRALRTAERFWIAVSWACLLWAASAPAAAAVNALTGAAPGPDRAAQALFALASVAALLRIVVSPACVVFIAVAAWKVSEWPAVRRRMRWALVLEACGGLTFAAWLASVALSHR